MQCIADTDIPIPLGCDEWTIVGKFDPDDITPETLEQTIAVRVGRDYHSSSIHEHVSPFTAIVDLDTIMYILFVCGRDYAAEYVDPRMDGNIMHALALNPNIKAIEHVISELGYDVSVTLINGKDRCGRKPIELIPYNKPMFDLLKQYTEINEEYAEYLLKHVPIAKYCL